MDKLGKVLAAMLVCMFAVMMAGAGTAKAETEVTSSGLHFNKDTYKLWDDFGNELELLDEIQEKLEAGERCMIAVNGDCENGNTVFHVWTYPAKYDLCAFKAGSDVKFCLMEGFQLESCNVSSSVVRYTYIYQKTDGVINEIAYNSIIPWDVSSDSIAYGGAEYFYEEIDGLEIIYSDIDIYSASYDSEANTVTVIKDTLYYDKDNYDIREWCADAGLNCAASSNESTSVIPFWFNEKYIYIVRKCITPTQTSGTWLMSMIYYSDDSVHYPYYREVSDLGYIGLASTSETTQTITVRNFVYDEAGGGWLLQEKRDCELSSTASVTAISNYEMLSDNIVMIYSNCDIYADAAKTSVWFQKSGEFYDVEIKLPEITREPIGSGSGSSSSGSSGTGGGALAFIISIMSMIWTDICGIEMDIDGYTITLQQIIVYAIIASIVGGLIVKLIFGRKG